MKPYAIFGAGFFAGAILVSGGFLISTKGGAVVYTASDANTASALIISDDIEVADAPQGDNVEEESTKAQNEQSVYTAPAVVEEESTQSAPSSDYVTELQEQVEKLIEQVNTQTTEEVTEEDSDENYFITPAGVKVKIDDDGNVIDDSLPEEGSVVTEPGVFITPGGIKIDANGNVIE